MAELLPPEIITIHFKTYKCLKDRVPDKRGIEDNLKVIFLISQ